MRSVAEAYPIFAEDAEDVVAAATRYAGLAMVAIGIAIIARSSFAFERTRRAIDSDEIIRIPHVPSGVAAFGRARDRRADFLHQSRADLTFATAIDLRTNRRNLRWI